jgi:ABC-type transport system involved in cytochrome bd biosynthesis fused ATPase/permease subunit
VQSWLDQGSALLSRLPEGVTIAAIIAAGAVGFFSRRMVVLVSCIIGAVIVFLTFVVPSYAAVILVAAVYLVSVIIALTGIVSRRKAPALHADFAQLRQDVNNLLAAENRRFLSGLRGSTEEQSANISRLPASKDPSAKTS